MVDRRLGVERDHRVFQLVGPQAPHHVRRDEDERVSDRELAAPDIRLQVAGREAAIAVGVGQRREARAPDQVGLRRPNGRYVELVGADDGHGHADGPGSFLAASRGQSIPDVGEPLVGEPDGLLEADPDPGRLVVVVLAADRVRRKPRRLAHAAAWHPAGDQEVEVALGTRNRAHVRLDDDQGVRGVIDAVRVRDHAELHLEPNGHAGLS